MKRKYFLLLLPIILFSITSKNYTQQEEVEQKLTYHRDDNNFLQQYSLDDREKYFPLNFFNRGAGVWTELNPNVPRVDYIGVDFINSDTGWACGLWGAFIRTTNAGQDWATVETPTGEILLKVHSYNGQIVIVVGHNGTVLRSSDGGESFTLLTGITTQELWGVKMLNDTLGWICGRNQTLLKTTDAGLTWQPVVTGYNYHYWSFDFLTEDYFMIACNQGKVLKTTNAGQSFTQLQAGNTQDLYTIDMIDSLHIAAAGSFGKNVYSSDGGINWLQNVNLTSSPVNWIQFIDIDTGFATVESSWSLYKTTNRGQSWSLAGLYRTGEWQFELLNENVGYGVGAELTVTKTEDAFNTGYNLFLNVNWSDVFFLNETKGFLISADLGTGLYKTEDGGISYQKIENAPSGYDLFFLDMLTGFIAGTHKTTDGGENWYSVNGGGTKTFFINDSIGWSIGGSEIYRTIDGGENWFVQSNSGWSFTSIYFVNSVYGWASQVGGRPFKTTDGGLNWIEQTNLNIWDSRDIYFRDSQNGCLVGFNELYNTTDSGITWILIPNITGFNIAELSTFQDSTIFIIGDKTFRSLDAGESWFEFTELNGITLTGMNLLNSGFGFAVGDLGLIMKYFDTTYVPVELISFEARLENYEIVLSWVTASELNNEGFYVEKSFDKMRWETIGFVRGKGSSTEINSYSFIDYKLTNQQIYYRLKQVDYNGSFNYSKIVEIEIPINDFSLLQNFPNPANPSTNISFLLPTKTKIEINLYSISGELLKEILNEEKEKGRYIVNINLSYLASGIYFYRMTTNKGYSNVKKIILLK